MDPVIFILFTDNQRLDNISVVDYKKIIRSDSIWAWSLESELAKDIIGEELSIHPLPEITEESPLCCDTLVRKLSSLPDYNRLTLLLPGSLIKDYPKVMDLEKLLHGRTKVYCIGQASSMAVLIDIMAGLRSAGGCPWDKEQNHFTLKKYLIEEAYEVIDAIDSKDMHNLCEELGDLLLQVVFHARIAEEAGMFTMNDVIEGISEKLVRRHPHVFGSIIAKTSSEVILNWEAIKKTEKSMRQNLDKPEDFFKVPRGLPALMMAQESQKKAAKVGFDWDSVEGPLDKIYEELAELKKEIHNGHRQKEELGDLLFSIVNLSRFLEIDAEDALRSGVNKFQKRFNAMNVLISNSGLTLEDMTINHMDIFWEKAKIEEKNGTLVSF